MGLEPVFEPAPIQNAASDRAARLFGEKPADTPQWFDDADRPEAVQLPDLDARPDVDPFGEMLLAEASVKGNRVRSQAKEMKREKVPGRMTQSRGRSVKACTKADVLKALGYRNIRLRRLFLYIAAGLIGKGYSVGCSRYLGRRSGVLLGHGDRPYSGFYR